jgi:hypothetical protein
MPVGRRDSNEKAELAPGQVSSETGEEKTLAGSAIGAVWDVMAGPAQTKEAKVDRAHTADEYAEIAADTFAAIPKFKTVVGGLARGVLLADVSGEKSVGAWSVDFATNVAEGALLNQAGKLALHGGKLNKFATEKLGGGLVSELAIHGTSGAAFGAVKGGFNIDGARDEKGNFSSKLYLENLALSTTLGGTIGVPAGFVGSRVARVVSTNFATSAESSVIAQTVRQSVTAGAGGFAGGAVFGGVESLREAKSLSDVMSGILKGGTIGFLTGGVAGAFEPRLSFAPGRTADGPDHPHLHHEAIEKVPASRKGGSGERDELLDKRERKTRDVDGDNENSPLQERGTEPRFDYEALSFKPTDVRIRDFESKIKLVKTEDRSHRRLADDAPTTHDELLARVAELKEQNGKFDYTDFWHKMTVSETRKMHIYEVEGSPVKIVVPEEYAKQLDQVRNLRKAHETDTPYDGLPLSVKMEIAPRLNSGDANVLAPYLSQPEISKVVPVIQSGLALLKHAYAHRALPEDMVPIIHALPNPRLVKEIVLSDRPDWTNPYYQAKYDDPKFRAAADVSREGVITHYQGKRGNNLVEFTFHEWAHLTKWASPEYSKMFDMATLVDKVGPNFNHKATRLARADDPAHPDVVENDIFFTREHASRTPDENWAVAKGELFMGPDPDGLWVFAQEAPVRALTLSTALEASYTARRSSSLTDQDRVLLDRLRYVDEVARPLAIKALTGHLQSGTAEQKVAAARLLGLYGDDTAIGALRKAASSSENNVKPDWENYEGFVNPIKENAKAKPDKTLTVASEAVIAMIKLKPGNDHDRMLYALEQAKENPKLRSVIAENWGEYGNHRIDYKLFLELYDKPSHVNQMQRLIETRFGEDPLGRKMAFDEIMRLTDGDSRAQTGFLLRNFTHVPGLRSEVVTKLQALLGTGGIRSLDRQTVQEYFNGLPVDKIAPAIRKPVDDLITHMDKERMVEAALARLGRPGRNHTEVMQELAVMRDPRAIQPLLKQAIGGNAENQAAALSALGHFNPSMVSFYGQQLRRDYLGNSVMNRRLENLLKSHAYVRPLFAANDTGPAH